jgi:hypothetical protein
MPRYIRTFSGTKFHIPNTRQEEVQFIDIAHGLAVAPRWGGQCRIRYPVIAHCLYVAAMLPPNLKFDGLMHDSSEAYLCDLPAPIKALIPGYKKIEHDLMLVISSVMGFSWPVPHLVKLADAVALYEERKALFDLPVGDDAPEIADRQGLQVPKNWDWEMWGNLRPGFMVKLFTKAFNEYRQLGHSAVHFS